MIFLAADIGGTRSRLMLAAGEGSAWRTLRRETLSSPDHASVDALLDSFLRPGENPEYACLALAGPVEGQAVQLTNLPWRVDAAALARRRGFREVRLINDFAAQANGLAVLGAGGLHTLQTGTPVAHGPRLLLGAGTGLGMALLLDGDAPRVLPSECGHGDFAPTDPQQIALLQYLRPHLGRVSLEHLLSGHGLARIHAFIKDQPAQAPLIEEASAISTAGLKGEPAAAAALDLFARIYASTAGNLALAVLPRGGVYLSGGIAPKILPFLARPETLAAFRDKPPMVALLEKIPLHVVTDEHLGLHGAAHLAAQLAHQPD